MIGKHLYSDEDVKRFVTQEVFDALIHKKIGEDDLCQLWLDAIKLISDVPINELREMIVETIRSNTYGRTPLSLLYQIEVYRSSKGKVNE